MISNKTKADEPLFWGELENNPDAVWRLHQLGDHIGQAPRREQALDRSTNRAGAELLSNRKGDQLGKAGGIGTRWKVDLHPHHRGRRIGRRGRLGDHAQGQDQQCR